MNRYRIYYTDDLSSGCPTFSYVTRAHNLEHAEMRFYDAPDADGWRIVKIKPAPPVRQPWRIGT